MLTLTERERLAFTIGDAQTLALIYQNEDEFAEVVSPEHEAVIDDRNRLRDALTECMERMHDAIEQLDTLNTSETTLVDIVTGEDPPPIEFAPAFHDATELAAEALAQCESQLDDTARERLAKADATIASLRRTLAAQDGKLRMADAVLRDAQALVIPYRRTSKPAPKWAQRLIATLGRTAP